MKKIFLPLLFQLVTGLCNAQVFKSAGVKGGFSVSNQLWHYPDRDSPERISMPGGYSAASVEFLKSKFLNIVLDVSYCQKGCRIVEQRSMSGKQLGEDSYYIKLAYFAASPMLKARYEFSHVIPYVAAGFRFDFESQFNSEFLWLEEDHKKTIYGLNFCGGLEYKNEKGYGIFCEAQYQNDLTNFMNADAPSNSAHLEIKNTSFIFCVGFRYYPAK